MSNGPNPFADQPRPPGAVRLESVADPLDPYAAPVEVTDENPEPPVGVWRDGELLVIHEGVTSLPNRCVLTNKLLTVRCRQQLSLGSPLWRNRQIILHFGLIETIQRPMERSRNRWTVVAAACALPGLITIVLMLVGYFWDVSAGVFLLSLLVSTALLVRAATCENVFKIRAVKDPYVWLTGAGPPFLDSLPKWTGRA